MSKRCFRSGVCGLVITIWALLLALVSLPAAGQDAEGSAAVSEPTWKEVDTLIADQRFERASEVAAHLRAQARETGDDSELTRALIKETQLRVGLHGTETAVRFLRDQVWPDDPRSRWILNLFYGRTLAEYLRSYHWEVQGREKVVTDDEVDLKQWTQEQIIAEIHRVYGRVWSERQAWGEASIGDWAEFIEQNDYPARVRGTLRDAVTYLWNQLLIDRLFWSPEESQELFKLNPDALLGDDLDIQGVDELVDAHPLEISRALLKDLSRWHRNHGRAEAAFEAELTLLRNLRSSFSHQEDVETLLRWTRLRLDEVGSRLPWWSEGQAFLARLTQSSEASDALVQARALAIAGAEAHPKSRGAERCLQVVEEVEAKSFSLEAMAIDGPGRQSLEIHHKNLARVHFRAYAFDLGGRLQGSKRNTAYPDQREVQTLLKRDRPVAEWTTELPAPADYRSHRTLVTPPLENLGGYVIVASMRRDFDTQAANQLSAIFLQLSDLVLWIQGPRYDSEDRSFQVRARSGATGEPLPDVEVDVFQVDWRHGHKKTATLTLDALGNGSFLPAQEGSEKQAYRHQQFMLAARLGADRAVYSNSLYGGYSVNPAQENELDLLIYTDRSVYRPGQEVLWKVVAYERDKDSRRFQVRPHHTLTLWLTDANGETVTEQKVTTNEHGSASGAFSLPTGRLLGGWSLTDSNRKRSASIVVEEYKRPTFKVQVDKPKSELRLNHEAVFEGRADYYFGQPLRQARANWRVERVAFFPSWAWGFFRGTGEGRVVAQGEAILDDQGRFEARFTPEGDPRVGGGRWSPRYRFRLTVEVTDTGGETRNSDRSFVIGDAAVEADFPFTESFFLADDELSLQVRRRHLDGTPLPGQGRWQIQPLVPPKKPLLPSDQSLDDAYPRRPKSTDDLKRNRWDIQPYSPERMMADWSVADAVADGTLEHGADGLATITTRLAAGAYRLSYQTEDSFGRQVEQSKSFLVAGADAPFLPLPHLLLAQKNSVESGATARFLVSSGFKGRLLDLIIARHGREVERRTLISQGAPQLVEIETEDGDRGGFTVELTTIRDYQPLTTQRVVTVPWSDRRLELQVATFRDTLRPGHEETWRFSLKNAAGEQMALETAELLAYMYDKSLELWAQHSPPDPLTRLAGADYLTASESTIGRSPTLWQVSRLPRPRRPTGYLPDRLKFFDNYAIGGPGRRGGPRHMMKRSMAPMSAMAAPQGAARGISGAFEAAAEAPAELAKESVTKADALYQDAAGSGDTAELEVRTDFSETAFWQPHLLIDEHGEVQVEFTVPDSVTEWDVWLHAVTDDLRYTSLRRTARTVKDLLVRPYMPRFFRAGDRAELRVVVNNSGEVPLSGSLDFEIYDPDSEEDLASTFGLTREQTRDLAFSVAAGQDTSLVFPVTAPSRLGTVAVRAVARTEDLSDGEVRPLPVLPSRLYLAQSRFGVLQGPGQTTLEFADLSHDDDPSRENESLVVNLDAQLFYGVLGSLPYLVEYPYSCTEQTLNRFVSTGILSSLFDRYPSVAVMAKTLSKQRDTPLDPWNDDDPNRRMLLEESPWLRQAAGGSTPAAAELLPILDPRVAAEQRRKAIQELTELQLPGGGFPWWAGGPASPYITLYVLHGLSRALEYEVEVPQELVGQSWAYMADWWQRHGQPGLKEAQHPEITTMLAWVLSSYPDPSWTRGVFTEDDLQAMVDYSWRRWRHLSPRIKGYLALVLARRDRRDDALKVWQSVMDSAKTDPRVGTYWAPEDRAWLWYNDTVESHAFALRVLTELAPDDARRAGLVQWLFLDKKLGHWKSTRATAEAIYALVKYLESEDALGIEENAQVRLGSLERDFVFAADQPPEKTQVVVAGGQVTSAMSKIEVSKTSRGTLFASATWHFSTDRLPTKGDGDLFHVQRQYFKRVLEGQEWRLLPIKEGDRLEVGDQLEVRLAIQAAHAAEYVHLRDPRGAGFEPEDLVSGYRWDLGVGHYREIRDSGTNFFFDWLPAGDYTFSYRVRAATAGTFRVGPAQLQSMYAPEFVAYSAGRELRIESEQP